MPLVGGKDPVAFEVFYDRHGGAAYSLAYRIVGSPSAAEDVTQEAFLSIWRSGARFDSWDDQLRLGLWEEAFTHFGIDRAPYLGTLPLTARLPWSHIAVGKPPHSESASNVFMFAP